MEIKDLTKSVVSIIGIIGVVVIGVIVASRPKELNVNDTYYKNEFLSGCMEEGDYAFCDCAYEALKKDIGLDGIMAIGLQYEDSDELPKEAYKAIAVCIDKLGN